jgi:hypothetical protein
MANVFFSYSHKDEPMRDDLEVHLASLKRQGVIATWHDRRILAGDSWEGKISEYLEQADIILLLVSPYFLASPYCNDVEVHRALQRHEAGQARVIPVILEPCDWQHERFGKLQSATRDGKPISKYPNKHDAFLEVVQAIRAAVGNSADGPAPRWVSKTSEKAKPGSGASEFRSSNLRVKKTLTDHDRDSFREASFEYIAKFFEGSLAELQKRNEGITSSFRRINANHFTAIIYSGGKSASRCGIRLGGELVGRQILFSHDSDSTNSWNDSLAVEDDGYDLFLKPSGLSGMLSGKGKGPLSQQGAAEYFWELLIQPLQR